MELHITYLDEFDDVVDEFVEIVDITGSDDNQVKREVLEYMSDFIDEDCVFIKNNVASIVYEYTYNGAMHRRKYRFQI